MIKHALAVSAVTLALAACSPPSEPKAPDAPSPPATPTPGPVADPAIDPTATATPDGGLQGGTDQWKTVASPEDQDRVARLDEAWRKSMREANNEFGAQIDALGMVAVKDAGLGGAAVQPAPGKYRCRTLKFGSMDGKGLAYVAYPWFTCTVELTPGGDLILTKSTGSQRTRGLIYPDPSNDKRLIYVGAQAWGDETEFPAYGANPERDQVGVVERVGAGRWRMVVPWPKQESKLDILEIRQ